MSTNSINNFFRNHSKRVYKNSGKQRRAQSPSPTESFKREQEYNQFELEKQLRLAIFHL